MLRLLNRVSFNFKHLRTYSVQAISNTTSEDADKKRQVLELEVDLLRQEGKQVPSKISESEWERVLGLASVSARRKYYTFLFKCEMTNENMKRKKQERAIEREERLAALRENEKDHHIIYGLGRNSIFLKIYETTMNLWHNNKLIQAMQFSPKLVIDLSYDEHMNLLEADNCAKQLTFTFATNRLHNQPFDLHFCNFDINSKCGGKLARCIPTMLNTEFPMNVHTKSYLDVFDKEKLVYLTPHCREELVDYNPDDVYIVGAMVDKARSEPLSVAKAKKYGLRMAKLPLDRYFTFQGGKCLTINQMLEIMLAMKESNDWKKSLTKVIPRRKISAEIDDLDLADQLIRKRSENKYNRAFQNDRSHFNKFTKNIKTYNDQRNWK